MTRIQGREGIFKFSSSYFHFPFRDILEERGLGWVAPAHKNNHGSNTISRLKVETVFANSTKSEIRALVEKYRLDFRLCGYEDTLEEMVKISEDTK